MKVAFITRSTLFSVPGGDTIQIQSTAEYLKKLGVEIDILLSNTSINYSKYAILHFFNIIRPADIYYHITKTNAKIVISPIFVDYSEYDTKARGGLYGLFAGIFSSDTIEYLKAIIRSVKNNEPINTPQFYWWGQTKTIREILKKTDFLLPNSESEYQRLLKKYKIEKRYIVVPNAVNRDLFSIAEEDISKKEGVICVARIEGLKNQLNIIKAVKNEFRLKFIGKPAPNHLKYAEICKKTAGNNIEFINHISHLELKEYYKKAKVHVLASWFETTGLSTLEAAVMGCNIVITDKGDQKEYFKDFAYYCEPDNVESIKNAIEKALHDEVNPKLRDYILENFTWEKTAEKTLEAYKLVLN